MGRLIDTILGAVSPDAIASLAGDFGEAPATTQKGLAGVIPVLLGAMVAKAEHGGRDSVTELVRSELSHGHTLDAMGAKLGDPLNRGALTGSEGGFSAALLGTQFEPITAALSSLFGLKGETTRGLLHLGGPLVAGGIGRLLGGNPEPEGVANLLQTERSAIMGALPAGLSGLLTPLTGTAATSAANAHIGEPLSSAAVSPLSRWLPWLLAGLAAIAFIFGLRSCSEERALVAEDKTETLVTEAPPSAAAPIPAGSGVLSEVRDGRPVLIVFFATGESEVPATLAASTSPMKEYLDSHPEARLAVSGFHDPTGDAAVNAALANDRAERVKMALIDAGIAERLVTLEKPADTSAADADTLAQARRVEVIIRD